MNRTGHEPRRGSALPASPAAGLRLAAVLLILGGCAPSKVTITQLPDLGRYQVKTVVLVPFEALSTPQSTEARSPEFLVPQGAKRSDISVVVPSPPVPLDQPTVVVPPQAAEKVTELFYKKLQVWEGLRVLSPEEAARATRALGPGAAGLALEEAARQVAHRLSADAALVGRVLIYQERVGSKLGAEPATVGFEVKLVGTDGAILWVGNYYEKQRPMNEDFVGFLERGGVFVTADQLAEYGAERVIRSFPFGAPPQR